jgi:hypothetical protein
MGVVDRERDLRVMVELSDGSPALRRSQWPTLTPA